MATVGGPNFRKVFVKQAKSYMELEYVAKETKFEVLIKFGFELFSYVF